MATLIFVIVSAIALGSTAWIGLTIWIVVRQVQESKLRFEFFITAILIQVCLIALPVLHHNQSVSEAGLSEFTNCPNNQEYCDAFWELAALDAQFFFFLGITFWVGVAVWLLTFLLIQRKVDNSQ